MGLLEADDPGARYWGAETDELDSQTPFWPTHLLFVPEESFYGALPVRIPSATARYLDVYQVERGALDSRSASRVADGVASLERRLAATESRPNVESELVNVLRTFDAKLFFVRIPLLVLLLQIVGVVAYYLLVVSTMLVERQASEIATLRSRGASTAQLLAQYGVEAALLASLAVIIGPPLAATVISALGPTPAFSDLSGGEPLDVHLSRLSFALAGAGALLAFLAFMVPAWQATRQTVIGFKRGAARPRRAPLFLRYYLDVALVIVLALVFWRLRQQDELFEKPLFGEPQADPFLLTTPAVVMITAGIVFLRLFPLVLRLAAWAVARSRAVALLVGTRALARNPTHYSRLILMLMLATGVGMFGATFSATLDRSFDDRTRYEVGADVRASDLPRALQPGRLRLPRGDRGGPRRDRELRDPRVRIDHRRQQHRTRRRARRGAGLVRRGRVLPLRLRAAVARDDARAAGGERDRGPLHPATRRRPPARRLGEARRHPGGDGPRRGAAGRQRPARRRLARGGTAG